MKLAGKRVLVTGGAGFIGSHLAEALLKGGCSVRVLVHYNSMGRWGYLDGLDGEVKDNLDIVLGDVSDAGSVGAAVSDRDVVFHLAALIGIPYSYRAPWSYVATNLIGTLNVLDACRANDVERLVHTSTSEVYGTAMYTPIDESHPIQGQSPYSASKISADKMAEAYSLSFNLPVATLRPFNTYGPRQSARAVIPTIVAQALRGQVVHLGSLFPIRDLTFVSDTVAAFMAIAESDSAIGRVVNAGNGHGITIGELASTILRLMGRDDACRIVADPERVRPSGSEVGELICDNRLADELMGWKPAVKLESGLRQTIEYITTHPEMFRAERYNL